MPFRTEHAARMADPKQFDRIRRKNNKFGRGIDAVFGMKNGKSVLQAIRFDAAHFTPAMARKWLKEHGHSPMMFESAARMNAAEIQANALRREMFDGKKHIVAPVVLLVEGVHKGSGGAVFYPAREIEKSAQRWNGMPLPVIHPKRGDDFVSARTPEVIAERGVGWLFNVQSKDDGKKLVGELWVDEEKASRIDQRVVAEIEAGTLEVSTGLFDAADGIAGVWHGEAFESTVRNYQPDHLALLPGGKGACSRQDGCGVRAAQAQGGSMPKPTVFVRARKLVSDLLEALSDDEPEVPVGNETTPGTPPAENEEESVSKKELVDKIVGCNCGFEEADRASLEALEEMTLTKMVANAEATVAKLTALEADLAKKVTPPAPPPPPPTPPEPAKQTAEQFVANAPPEIAASLNRALARDRAQKNALVSALMTNERCKFTKEQLEAKEIEELETLAELAETTVNFAANGGSPRPVANEDAIEPMPNVMDALRAQKV
jgi:hypothetical protein